MRRLFMTLGLAYLLMAPTLAAAQQATPVTTQATPAAGEDISLLFVQTASSSTLTPLESPDGEATHELVLQERSDQTIFFADRPNRQVGTMPTTALLDMFAAEPDNPPNAALVALNEAGEEEIIVLELLSGTEDATTGELTYQVKLLADYTELELGLVSEPVTDVTEARSYGDTSLFIDSLQEISDRLQESMNAPGVPPQNVLLCMIWRDKVSLTPPGSPLPAPPAGGCG